MQKADVIRAADSPKTIRFLPVLANGSALGLWHRPRTAQLKVCKEAGVGLVVSI